MKANSATRRPQACDGITLLTRLQSISKSVRQLVGINLAACEVMPGQDQFLFCLADDEQRSVIEISNALSVRPSTVSKMVDILERKGWVMRCPDDRDARRVLVSLTDEGRRIRENVSLVHAKLDAELLAAMDGNEKMVATLARLEAILAKRLRRLR